MPEAKSILSSVLSVLVGLVMLGMLSYVILTNSDIWHVFARQNDASQTIRNYSEYAAYDGTTVRGQDVMSLVSKTQGDPFVIVAGDDGGIHFASYDAYTQTLKFNTLDTKDIQSLSCYPTLQNTTVENCMPASNGVIFDYANGGYPDTDMLQDVFLRGTYLSDGGNKYATFDAYLVYEGAPSTDVVGVVLVKR